MVHKPCLKGDTYKGIFIGYVPHTNCLIIRYKKRMFQIVVVVAVDSCDTFMTLDLLKCSYGCS